MAVIKKSKVSVGENVEKRKPSCTVGGNVYCYSHYEDCSKNLKRKVPYDPSNLISGPISKGNEIRSWRRY